MNNDSQEQQLVREIQSAINEDGEIVQIAFTRNNGKTAYIQLDYNSLSDLYLCIEQAATGARKQQKKKLKGFDPRKMFPVRSWKITKISGAISSSAVPMLMLQINGSIDLCLSLEGENIQALISWLQQLDEAAKNQEPVRQN